MYLLVAITSAVKSIVADKYYVLSCECIVNGKDWPATATSKLIENRRVEEFDLSKN
ncbi:MAG: hypothetical protein M3530_07465 [Thermoproteota archaeon]|nr:hypothetical protein [Thermoproteota archaeon]